MIMRLIAAVFDAMFAFVPGIVVLLLGLRIIGKKPGESEVYDKWYTMWERKLKVIGGCLMLLAAIIFARDLFINRETTLPGEVRARDNELKD